MEIEVWDDFRNISLLIPIRIFILYFRGSVLAAYERTNQIVKLLGSYQFYVDTVFLKN